MIDILYLIAIGCLICAMITKGIDIICFSGQVNKLMANRNSMYWSAIKQITRYIEGSLNFITCKCEIGHLEYPHLTQIGRVMEIQ